MRTRRIECGCNIVTDILQLPVIEYCEVHAADTDEIIARGKRLTLINNLNSLSPPQAVDLQDHELKVAIRHHLGWVNSRQGVAKTALPFMKELLSRWEK